MRELSFTLNFALPSLNARQRTNHWELSRQRNRLIHEIMAAIGGPRHYPRPPFKRARVNVVRCSSGKLDPDAIAATCKPLLDALCLHSSRHPGSLGIIEDDNPQQLDLMAIQSDAARGNGSTIVCIQELEPLQSELLPKPESERKQKRVRHTAEASSVPSTTDRGDNG